jgi:dihydroorotate dehydrogenase (NAD+) catalytic subunit
VASSALAVTAAGIEFQNPVLLAAGTAAYGRELANVIDIDALGGLVT